MVLAKCDEQSDDKMQTKISAEHVGIIPDRANVAGKLSMAGPVKELTAMDMEPSIPMEPLQMDEKKRKNSGAIRKRMVHY